MRVAIIHYWLVGMRGGEKVLEGISDMYPDADIFTHVVNEKRISEQLRSHTIKTSFIANLPFATRLYQKYLPLMPMALEHLDLRGYDLIISSEAGPAKGIVPPAGAVHICYCHSPMRYVWNMYHDYRERAGFLTRLPMPWIAHYLRSWDQSSSTRVDQFVANSTAVAARIRKYYRRGSVVVHPPVEVNAFTPAPSSQRGDFHLYVGQLVAYKRPDLAVEAFNSMGRELVVIGEGEMKRDLEKIAGPTVKILGAQSFEALKDYYSRCQALVFPGEEDFGIVPLEAMASGRPVIAFGAGGALDTVVPGRNGVLFGEPTVESLVSAVQRCDGIDFEATELVEFAKAFNRDRFRCELQTVIDAAIARAERLIPESWEDQNEHAPTKPGSKLRNSDLVTAGASLSNENGHEVSDLQFKV